MCPCTEETQHEISNKIEFSDGLKWKQKEKRQKKKLWKNSRDLIQTFSVICHVAWSFVLYIEFGWFGNGREKEE